jgi:type I restriction enzyme S subunit
MAKLGEVCTIISGSTPKTSVTSYWDGNIKWITPAELNEDTFYIMDSVRHITEEGKEKTGLSYLPTGTVILSSRAPIGKTAIAGCKMCCNQGFKNLICSDAIYNEYLYFFLKSKTDYLNSLGRGATFKEISKSIVENIEIPLPEVNQQKEIAEKFKKLEQLISLRKQQLAKLDELIKARFVEMFGDPVNNPMNYPKSQLGKVCDVRDGTHDSPEYYDVGYPLVTSKNVTGGKIDLSECNLISEDDYKKICERSKVDRGDIIMPMIGTVGKPVIVNTEPMFAIKNVALIKFTPDSLVTNIYIKTLLESDYFDRAVLDKIRGGTQKFIALGDIRKLEIILPDLKHQQCFSTFVERVNQQKQTVQQSLDKLELMKKALMQEYFG